MGSEEGGKMGGEKLPFSQGAVAELEAGPPRGSLNIKEKREYEFDLCRRGQQRLTPDICKDTVTPKHL